jgi:DNA invertase Pin-like site-specific DNA recombinase
VAVEYVFEPAESNGTKLRAILYDRISDDPDGERENVEIRLAESRAYCEEQGWVVVAEFSDNDVSASKFSRKPRPGYNDVLAAVKAGAGEVIVTTEMERLYRRLEELLELIKLAEVTPLRQIACTDGSGYNLSTSLGIHGVIDAVNNAMLESAKISDRMKRKKGAKAGSGWWWGGHRPFGYELAEQEGRTRTGKKYIYYKLEIDPAEADLVREGVKRVLAGETANAIAHDWTRRGIRGARGGPFHNTQVARMLTSPHLAGLRTHRGKLVRGNWPAIIEDREEWETLRAALQRTPRPPRPRTYLLSGLLYCHCGTRMRGHGRNGRREYECRALDGGCGKTRRKADPIEEAVRDRALAALANPALRAALAAELQARQTSSGTVRELRARKKQDEGQLTHLRDRLADGKIDDDDFAHAKARITERLGGIERALAAAMPNPAARLLDSLPTTYPALQEVYAAGSLDRRQAILRLVLNRVTALPIARGRQVFDANRELAWDWKV